MTARTVLASIAMAASLTATQGHADSLNSATPNAITTAAPTSAASAAGHWREASLDDYRNHLVELTTLVQVCAKARDAKTCDPTLVGPDDHVPVAEGSNAERRLVRYGWLRVLLSKAQEKDNAAGEPADKAAIGAKDTLAGKGVRPVPRTTTELLRDAEIRLAQDLAETHVQIDTVAPPAYTQERDSMKQVLAGRDFRNLEAPSARDTILEKLVNWLNDFFDSMAKASAQSPWIGRLVFWGFIVVVCAGLAWGLIQLERRSRIRLVPESEGPAPGAASARDWQLWIEDARKAVAAGQWREAIHCIYWASISRLESRRLWPADRARTPREYLALVAAEDPRKAGLATLTGSFERIWYGGRPAGENDYAKAEQLATALISGSGAASAGKSGGRAG